MREEDDYAVGAEDVARFQFSSAPSFSLDDDGDEVHYRSLNAVHGGGHLESSVEVDMADEELVYRSLPMPPAFGRQASTASNSSSSSGPDASWLAAGRPPLLQRQRAFNRPSEDWMRAAGLEP